MNAYTIYGLRLRGDPEIRYVGVTRRGTEHRFRTHIYQAVGLKVGAPLGRWLLEHRPDVEIVSLASADNRADAFETERAIIALCLRMGHRLLNHMHVLPHPAKARKQAAAA